MSRKNPNPKRRFATPQSLSEWLRPHLPSDSFASWGVKPGTKNVHSLWIEIADGETSPADSTPPIRTLDVVILRIIGQDGRILIELHQELSNGIVRNRCRPLSEKMKPGESVEDVVAGAVREELGSVIRNSCDLIIVPNLYAKKVEERVSVSYPGLPACYALHSVDACVWGGVCLMASFVLKGGGGWGKSMRILRRTKLRTKRFRVKSITGSG